MHLYQFGNRSQLSDAFLAGTKGNKAILDKAKADNTALECFTCLAGPTSFSCCTVVSRILLHDNLAHAHNLTREAKLLLRQGAVVQETAI
jgi:hypothetical protein